MAENARLVIQDEIFKELRPFAHHLTGVVQKRTPTATGILRGSIVPIIKRGQIRPMKIIARVGTPLEYGDYVEFGTKPHWPPFEPILAWVEKKHIGSPNKSRGIAHAIQATIAKRGTKAQRFFAASLRQVGLKFRLKRSRTESVYVINLQPWLRKRWPKIIDRVKKRI